MTGALGQLRWALLNKRLNENGRCRDTIAHTSDRCCWLICLMIETHHFLASGNFIYLVWLTNLCLMLSGKGRALWPTWQLFSCLGRKRQAHRECMPLSSVPQHKFITAVASSGKKQGDDGRLVASVRLPLMVSIKEWPNTGLKH